jgi:hypothetical protein
MIDAKLSDCFPDTVNAVRRTSNPPYARHRPGRDAYVNSDVSVSAAVESRSDLRHAAAVSRLPAESRLPATTGAADRPRNDQAAATTESGSHKRPPASHTPNTSAAVAPFAPHRALEALGWRRSWLAGCQRPTIPRRRRQPSPTNRAPAPRAVTASKPGASQCRSPSHDTAASRSELSHAAAVSRRGPVTTGAADRPRNDQAAAECTDSRKSLHLLPLIAHARGVGLLLSINAATDKNLSVNASERLSKAGERAGRLANDLATFAAALEEPARREAQRLQAVAAKLAPSTPTPNSSTPAAAAAVAESRDARSTTKAAPGPDAGNH